MLYFLEKSEKSPHRWGSSPKPPLASDGWELCPQTPELLKFRPIIPFWGDS